MNTVLDTKPKRTKGRLFFRYFLPGLIVFSFLFYVFFLRGFIEEFKEMDSMEKSRSLSLALFAYADDNNGKYPEGKSSTEIFQKLLDNGYLTGTENGKKHTNLEILYYPMPGKVEAPPGTNLLKPENVCWDVTCCFDTRASEELPVVFLTGYKVTYQATASIIPLSHPPRSWLDWWQGKDYPRKFIVVGYKSNERKVLKASPDGTIPNFIPADFDPKGKVYRQLTPDGELPP